MARTTRTFIAVAVPDTLGAKLSRLQTLLAPSCPARRWIGDVCRSTSPSPSSATSRTPT